MSGFRADIRHAVRRWAARPGLALTAMLTLGLGIGTATAIFSVVDGVLLRPLPYTDPDGLVTTWIVGPRWQDNPMFSAAWNRGQISWLELRDLEAHSRTLESVGVWTGPSSACCHAVSTSRATSPSSCCRSAASPPATGR